MFRRFEVPNRQRIHDAVANKSSAYAAEVDVVNTFLDKRSVGISDRSTRSVIANAEAVDRGERSEINAHQREALSFGRDAIESARDRNYRQAAYELAGSALNGFASLAKAATTQTPLGLDPW